MTDAEAWGIAPGYHDYRGEWRATPEETERRILEAMGAGEAHPPEGLALVVTQGERPELPAGGSIRFEDGGEVSVGDAPPELPLGYHSLVAADQSERPLIVGPGRCHLPDDLRCWGWGLQLYSARSKGSWGIGDFVDLAEIGRWSRDLGAEVVLLNPVHAPQPGLPQQPSPYSPTTRCWRSPLYLRIEAVPGAGELDDLDELKRAGRALNSDEFLDRDAVYRLKMDTLERIWKVGPSDNGFERYRVDGGSLLEDYAVFVTLAEHFGPATGAWPSEYRHPRSPAVARWRKERSDRVRFHQWIQWLLEEQLDRAQRTVGVIHDLAVGVDPQGADAWVWSDVFAPDMKVGAPPDEFNSLGQDWGLPPFDPWKLRATGYDAFIQTMRAGLRHGAGLRVDHVMGLFRLFWIPSEEGPAAGTYVRYPHRDLLNILALESHRAGAFVVGEDLGTVEPFVRDEMAARNMLSYRIMWFEPGLPHEYPEHAMAAVGNHDIQTIAGLWTGSDLEEQLALGIEPNVEGIQALRSRLCERLGVSGDASVDEVIVKAYEHLAGAPSRILVATLEDALAAERRPNQPGTTSERPNWSIPLPLPVEQLIAHPRPRAIAGALRR